MNNLARRRGSKRLTEAAVQKKIRRIIREEYLRSTPETRPGQLMSEHRAELIAEQLVEAGLWAAIKAGASSLKGATKSLGGAALEPLKGVGQVAGQVAKLGLKAAEDIGQAIQKIEDDAVKAAAQEAQASLKKSIANSAKNAITKAVPALVKAGMETQEAKAFVAELVAAEMAALTAGADTTAAS